MRKIIIAILLIIASLTLVWFYYNKPHRSVASEKAVRVDAVKLFEAFQINETEANLAYLNKVLEVSGKVAIVDTNAEEKSVIVLETNDAIFGINCTLDNTNKTEISVGDSVVIKGICTGYLSDVVLVECSAQIK